MKRLFATLLILLGSTSVAVAETTTFKQQILPIDCVYEVIDVGTQKLRYITPDTCPIDPGPPIITEPPTTPISPVEPTKPQSSTGIRWSYMPPVAVAPPEQKPDKAPAEEERVQGIIAVVKDVIIQNKDSAVLLIVTVGLWWLLLFAIRRSNNND